MNRPQIEWIFNNVERITNKYLAAFPLNEEQWKELYNEMNAIYGISKKNEEVKDILFAVMNYFDKLDALYRRAVENEQNQNPNG